MSTDLKIDLFAKDLFNALWEHHGLRAEPPPQHPPTNSEFNENIFRAVQVRLAMYHCLYLPLFQDSHDFFEANASYFFDAIVDFFPHDLSEEASVMCKFLSSCAYVADMCMCFKMVERDLSDVGSKAWAMFANLHLKDAFYEAGGWEQLQAFAQSDLVVYDYVRKFSDVTNYGVVRNAMRHSTHLTCSAVEAFNQFEDWTGVDEDAPYVLKWVDYCVHVPFMKIRNQKYYEDPIPHVFNELEAAIWSLGLICDPAKDDDCSSFSESSNSATSEETTSSSHFDVGLNEVIEKFISGSSEKWKPGESFHETDHEIGDSDNGNIEQVAFVKHPIPKLVSFSKKPSSSNEETDSSKDDQDSSLQGKGIEEDDELVNLAKHSVKTYERTHRLKFKNKINDQINFDGNSPLDDEVASKPTTEHSKTENVENADAINMLTPKNSFRYQVTEGEKSSVEPTVENQFKLASGAESKSTLKTKVYYNELLGKTEYKKPSVKPPNEKPLGFDGKKAKKEKSKGKLNSNYPNHEALQTSQRENTTAKPALENPCGFSSRPQDVKKKGKKRKPKKPRIPSVSNV